MPRPSSISGTALAATALTGVALPKGARPAMGPEGLAMLSGIPIFSGLPKRHLRRVAGLADVVRFADGAVIVRAGSVGRALYVIAEGRAKVFRDALPTGRALARLAPGDFFGEIALLDGGTRSASVVADGPVVAVRLMRAAFLKLMRTEPDIALAVVRTLAERLRKGSHTE